MIPSRSPPSPLPPFLPTLYYIDSFIVGLCLWIDKPYNSRVNHAQLKLKKTNFFFLITFVINININININQPANPQTDKLTNRAKKKKNMGCKKNNTEFKNTFKFLCMRRTYLHKNTNFFLKKNKKEEKIFSFILNTQTLTQTLTHTLTAQHSLDYGI